MQVSVKSKHIPNQKKMRKLDNLQAKKLNLVENKYSQNKDAKIEVIDSEIAELLDEMRSSQYKTDIEKLQKLNHAKGKSAATFVLCKKLLGNKKGGQEQIMILNDETGEEVYDHEEIKRVSQLLCKTPNE